MTQALAWELSAHTTFEEEIFYPAVREGAEATKLVAEAVTEHHEAEDLLERILEMEVLEAFKSGRLQKVCGGRAKPALKRGETSIGLLIG